MPGGFGFSGSRGAGDIPDAPVTSVIAMAVVTVMLALWSLYLYRGQGWRPHVIGYGVAALVMGAAALWYFFDRL